MMDEKIADRLEHITVRGVALRVRGTGTPVQDDVWAAHMDVGELVEDSVLDGLRL